MNYQRYPTQPIHSPTSKTPTVAKIVTKHFIFIVTLRKESHRQEPEDAQLDTNSPCRFIQYAFGQGCWLNIALTTADFTLHGWLMIDLFWEWELAIEGTGVTILMSYYEHEARMELEPLLWIIDSF